MDHLIAALAANQHGLVTRVDLRRIGVSKREVDRWLRSGDLVLVRTGCYTTRELWASWDEFRHRPLARARAAHLGIGIEHTMSHESAALAWDLPLVDSRSVGTHITRSDKRATRVIGGVWHHGAAYAESQVCVVNGLPVLDVTRTVLDLSRRRDGFRAGLVAADAALRRGVPRKSLIDLLGDQMAGWPFTRTAARVVRDADGGAANAGESLARELVLEAGLGPVETQFPVPHQGGTYFGDMRVGRHIIEFDGRIKYRGAGVGGSDDRELEEILWEERRREREIRSVGLGVSRLVYADFWGAARERAKVRLRADHAEIVRRWGTALPAELERFAADARACGRPTAS